MNQEELIKDQFCATVVNLMPIVIEEKKPHLIPGIFVLKACTEDEIGGCIVHECHYYIDNPLFEVGKPGSSIKQIVPANTIAESLVVDYKYSHVAVADGAEPGIFWLPGRQNLESIKANPNFNAIYRDAVAKQKNWYRNLIAMADADWEKNHNMLAVSDLSRMAARDLRVRKNWVEFVAVELTVCPMCAINVNAAAVICQCGFILKPDVYAANQARFVGGVPNNTSKPSGLPTMHGVGSS